MGRQLSLQEMLGKTGIKTKEVEIDELGGSITIGSFTLAKRDEFVKVSKEDPVKAQLVLLKAGMVEPAITEENFEQLKNGDATLLDKICLEIMRFNGLTQEGAKSIERDFRAEPRSEVSLPVGGETPPDGGGA